MLAGAAAAPAAALLVLAAGARLSIAIGPLALTVNDYRKPLAAGAVAAALLLAYGWPMPRWRRSAIALLAGIGLAGAVAYARGAAPVITNADFAVGELYVQLATEGRLLAGPYSRYGWHHPGPVYFYLAAPFYALAGRHALVLFAMALAINVVAVAVVFWTIAREPGQRMAGVLVTLACVGLAWRAPALMASPWTAHVPVLLSLAVLAMAAAIASGRVRLLPALAIAGSVVTHTHVGFVPVVVATAATALAMHAVRSRARDRSVRTWLNRAAWCAALLWLPVTSDAVAHDGGNALSLWRFFVSDAAVPHPFRDAVLTWAYGLTGLLRPDFSLAWGAHFERTGLAWALPCAIGQVLLLGAIAMRGDRSGRPFETSLATVALVASVTSLWAVTRIRGDVLDHDVFRLAALGAFNLGVIAACALRIVAERVRMPAVPRGAWIAVVLLTLGGTALLAMRQLEELTGFERRHPNVAMTNAYTAIRRYIDAEGIGRPLIRIGEDRWGDAAGILLRLTKDGTSVAVEERWTWMFTDAFGPTGAEDAVISLADLELHRRLRGEPGTTVLFESHPLFVDAVKIR